MEGFGYIAEAMYMCVWCWLLVHLLMRRKF